MSALRAVQQLGLRDWCIGAGAVRNLVWDALHGFSTPSVLPDVDVAYFDAADLSPERDAELQHQLHTLAPGIPWEVTNQAAVHLWFERVFGHPVQPLHSLEDAIATWPEFVTCVGLTLAEDDQIHIVAPHGLDDLFSMTIRRNPARVSPETFRQRVIQKCYQERWPRVTVIQ